MSKSRKAAEAMVKRTKSSSSVSAAAACTNEYGVTDEQLQDLREVFEVFTSQRGVNYLDAKKMLLAMRTLGFEPSKSEVQEMIEQYFSTKSRVKPTGGRRKKGSSNNSANSKNNGGKNRQPRQDEEEEQQDEGNGRRRSTRKAAQATQRGAPGRRSVYVDDSDEDVRSLGDEDEDVELESDDSDAYRQKSDDEDEEDDQISLDVELNSEDDDGDLGSDGSGEIRIRLDDFVRMMAPQMRDLYDSNEIDRVFQLFDTDGKGAIDIQDLRRVAKELAIPMKDHELREMVEEADKDRDQKVNRGEFARIMRRIGLLS